jgi:RNA polymerase sigma-70 factor (ECF subfamily)
MGSSISPLPDTRYSLIARLAEPADAAAWGEFVRIYQTAVYRYCRAQRLQEADAADVVQEVLLAVHKVAGQWHASGRAGSFRAWLFETARRVCLGHLRSRRGGAVAAGGSSALRRLNDLPGQAPDAPRDEAEWQRWVFCCAAAQAERESQPTTWRAFWLTAVEGTAAPVVADELGISIGSVYAAKCRVLARIRARIEE